MFEGNIDNRKWRYAGCYNEVEWDGRSLIAAYFTIVKSDGG